MAHTPGPWAYDEDSKEVFSSSDGYAMGWIALVKGNADSGRDFPEQERLANARLIAAAPELLAALRDLVAYDEGSSDEDSYGHELFVRCLAAIAKATGKESE